MLSIFTCASLAVCLLWRDAYLGLRLTYIYCVYAQLLSHVWLCDLGDCSPSDSSVHGISQARILEWVAISFSRGSSWPRDQTLVSCIASGFFTDWVTREGLQRHEGKYFSAHLGLWYQLAGAEMVTMPLRMSFGRLWTLVIGEAFKSMKSFCLFVITFQWE